MTSLRERVEAEVPRALADLADLVAIPSVSSDPARAGDVLASAELTARLFLEAGLADAKVVTTGGARPAVIAHRAGPPGAPAVLLYAHHDVQPTGDRAGWTVDPFALTERGDRLYGRGSSDDKGGIAVHLAVLRAFGDDLPVSVTVLVEGEEEIGSPAFPALLAAHAGELRADVVLVPDAVNAGAGVPSLTTMFRGLLDVTVELKTLTRTVHSGLYGGVLPCALTTMVRLLATLHDEDGSVAVDGLDDPDLVAPRTISEFGDLLLPGVRIHGDGDVAERLVTRHSISVLALDAVPVAESSNVLHAAARAKLGVRLPPGADPDVAYAAVAEHLRAHVGNDARLTVTAGAVGQGFNAPATDVQQAARRVLGEAYGAACVDLGAGGSIPFVTMLADAMPDADFLITAVQDPASAAHSVDESLCRNDFRAACVAQAELLDGLARHR
ncbi:MAG: cysteinylglycine-S-conjugate dipeptidase [Frankiaceae bacterium]|nr:cysteinylglycine-S-conjugate dipeptidase [Frankiaceae bacterium]